VQRDLLRSRRFPVRCFKRAPLKCPIAADLQVFDIGSVVNRLPIWVRCPCRAVVGIYRRFADLCRAALRQANSTVVPEIG
jgi:hypothetical protein